MDRRDASGSMAGRGTAALGFIAGWLAALALSGCAVAPGTTPTYEALDRGFRWQCEGSPDPDVCVRHKYLALQERRARQLTLNECAVTYGMVARARQAEPCRNAPEPQAIECRTLLGTMTCTIGQDGR